MKVPEPVDLLVVGAGPAGAAAAIRARQLGVEVAVVDKARFPRDKICGDGLTTNALRLLHRLGIASEDLPGAEPVGSVTVRSPSGREVGIELPRPSRHYSVVVPRRELDARLVAEARSWGAEVHEGLTLTSLVESDGTVTATCRDAAEQTVEFRARWVIAADGMWSATRRLLGGTPPGYRGDWHGFRQYFSSVSTRAQQELFVSFEADILPGYFWSFPLADGRANVGFGIQRPGTGLPTKVARVQAMGSIWQDILQRPHIVEFLGRDAQPEEPHRAWPIPARIGAIDLHHGRVLFVGDAAAACDPMTGEGIGQALQTGLYAATAIAQSATTGVAPGLRYEQMVRRSLLPDHRLAHLLASALGHRKGARAAVAVVDINDWTRRNFGRWLFEDYPRAALASPARWSAMRTRSSGATGMPPWEERLLR